MPFKSHEAFIREYLADPEMAAAYLNACIEDGTRGLSRTLSKPSNKYMVRTPTFV